jgi:hypothetical protein
VQFRARTIKPPNTTQTSIGASNGISPPPSAGSADADATLSFAAFAPDAKLPAFQDAKISSRNACADLQAASQSLSEVLKQVDAVLAQSASPTAAASQVTLPSPSLRRVSVSNIVSTFEQNKISPPVVVTARDSKRISFPPPSQGMESEQTSLATAKEQTKVTPQPPSPSDWTIVNSPAQGELSRTRSVDDAVASSCCVQLQSPATAAPPATDFQSAAVPDHALHDIMQHTSTDQHTSSEVAPSQFLGKAKSAFEERNEAFASATTASPLPSALGATSVVQHDPPVSAQIPASLQNVAVAFAAPVTAASTPAVARYTFEDVERITTFAKEELQRRADAEVAALTAQLALKTAQTQTLMNENTVLKDTLQQ